MAVEPIKKVTVVAHQELQDQVVDTLARLGTVHVDRVVEDDLLAPKELTEDDAKRVRDYSFGVTKVEFLLGFLREHASERPGFFKTLIKKKYPMTIDEFLAASQRVDLSRVYAECSELKRRLIGTTDRKAMLEQEIDELQNWVGLEMPLNEVKGDSTFGLMAVRVAMSEFGTFIFELESEVPESVVDLASKRSGWANCLLMYYPDVEETVTAVLSRHRYYAVTLPDIPDEPEDRLEQLARELTGLERRRKKILDDIEGYMVHEPALEVLREFLVDKGRKIDVLTRFGVTDATVAVEGWVTENGLVKTLEKLDVVSEYIAVEISEPEEGDNPPVSLDNPKWAKPFEILIKLFGSPNRREYDPTWIVAISFMVFFGFCIGDVGYGLILIPAFLLMRKYLPLGPKAKDLLTVLAYSSPFAILIGIFTGSWFGIKAESLPGSLRSVAFMDGLNKTTLAMGIAIGIGLIHLLIGVGIEFRDTWKGGGKVDALIDQGLIFLLFVGGGSTAALAAAKLVPVNVPLLVAGAAILGMLLLLGRSAHSIGGKVANGIYETYGTVVGFVSDAISYVRLFALGLATFIIAMVVNTMAGLVGGIAPVIGILLMLIVLVVGHTFNIAINLLGAFVHPLRLEFVEFFGKFYDDGGREFKPFGVESKIVMIEKEEGA
jgi:V/A-type H+-transporting ATPase subunit I